jgi:hypothetical protein
MLVDWIPMRTFFVCANALPSGMSEMSNSQMIANCMVSSAKSKRNIEPTRSYTQVRDHGFGRAWMIENSLDQQHP